ncbi:hypothetical protein APY04_0210 [Hyphomicrobium sulfonivorans]|uniref:Uncharacterized protein n=1 Tax=Hyphomicrobium sulfonivorans TaxID=121290 RepID=A0A109BPQ9_HYPSL|nr:hypothetical protein APY04_0210 [Hyphomicrobium sulfonivorans]
MRAMSRRWAVRRRCLPNESVQLLRMKTCIFQKYCASGLA